MYVPRPFQPDRQRELWPSPPRAASAPICAHDGRKPIASAVPFCIDYARGRHAATCISSRASQSVGWRSPMARRPG